MNNSEIKIESKDGKIYTIKLESIFPIKTGTVYCFNWNENLDLPDFNIHYNAVIDGIKYPFKKIEKTIVEIISWEEAGRPVCFLIDLILDQQIKEGEMK